MTKSFIMRRKCFFVQVIMSTYACSFWLAERGALFTEATYS